MHLDHTLVHDAQRSLGSVVVYLTWVHSFPFFLLSGFFDTSVFDATLNCERDVNQTFFLIFIGFPRGVKSKSCKSKTS